jgi:hypothetical protein
MMIYASISDISVDQISSSKKKNLSTKAKEISLQRMLEVYSIVKFINFVIRARANVFQLQMKKSSQVFFSLFI